MHTVTLPFRFELNIFAYIVVFYNVLRSVCSRKAAAPYVLYALLHVLRESSCSMSSMRCTRSRSRPWPRYIWVSISQNPLEIECQYQWNTYRKLPMGKRTVTWPMMSRDAEGQGRDPVTFKASGKQLKIAGWCQWSTYRKPLTAEKIIMWPMTSRDLERSRSRSKRTWGLIFRNPAAIGHYAASHGMYCCF